MKYTIALAAVIAILVGASAVVAGQGGNVVPTMGSFNKLEKRVTQLEERVTSLEGDEAGDPDPEPTEPEPTPEPTEPTTPEPTPEPTEPEPTEPEPTEPEPTEPEPTEPEPTPEPTETEPQNPTADGFPTADTTGVPAGVTLTPRAGGTISQDGTVIDGADITSCVRVTGKNVTIRNSRISCGGNAVITVDDAGGSLTVVDSEVDGRGAGQNGCIGWTNVTIRRVHVHNCTDGIRTADNMVVEDSLIESSAVRSGSHNDGIQSTDGSHIVIRGNTILNPNGQTSAIILKADFGRIDDVVIAGNYLSGGAFTLYGGGDYDGLPDATNVRVTDNTFGRDFYATSGQYGPVAYASNVAQWSGNVWSDTGAPVRNN